MAPKASNQGIKEYYDHNQILYDLVYSQGTNGMHYGFWDKNTKSSSDAILNTNRITSKYLEIGANDTVLDAGCGVGGTSIFIAEKSGANVHGITISDVQLKKAKALASRSKNPGLLSFSNQDFTRTGFKDGTFSKVFGIESVCHATKKISFLREAHRILKKNGRIVVADGFLARPPLTEREKTTYQKWLDGWALPHLAKKEEFYSDLKKAGFKKVRYHDMLLKVRKSRDIIHGLGFWGYPLSWTLFKLGIISKKMHDNTISCICQKKVFSDADNIATYGIFVAEK